MGACTPTAHMGVLAVVIGALVRIPQPAHLSVVGGGCRGHRKDSFLNSPEAFPHPRVRVPLLGTFLSGVGSREAEIAPGSCLGDSCKA